MSDKKHALYLVKDGESVTLFHADDVEQAQEDGWKRPDFSKSNGTPWNAEADLAQQDASAEFAKASDKADEKAGQKAAVKDAEPKGKAKK